MAQEAAVALHTCVLSELEELQSCKYFTECGRVNGATRLCHGAPVTMELFRSRSVQEVREVEERARATAEEKRNALKQRVAHSYVELLASADHVHSMHSTAERLVGTLQQTLNHANDAASCAAQLAQQQLGVRTPAAHRQQLLEANRVKGIVDAPEACYSALDEHNPLDAAFALEAASACRAALLKHSPDFTARYPLVAHSEETEADLRSEVISAGMLELQSNALSLGATSAARLLCAIALCSINTDSSRSHVDASTEEQAYDGYDAAWLLSVWLDAVEKCTCGILDRSDQSKSASADLRNALTGLAHGLRLAESLFAPDGLILAEVRKKRLEEDWSQRQRLLVQRLSFPHVAKDGSNDTVRSQIYHWLIGNREESASSRLAASCSSSCLQRVHSLDAMAQLEKDCIDQDGSDERCIPIQNEITSNGNAQNASTTLDLWDVVARGVCAQRAEELAVSELRLLNFQSLLECEAKEHAGDGEHASEIVCNKLKHIRKQICELRCKDALGASADEESGLTIERKTQLECVEVLKNGAATLASFGEERISSKTGSRDNYALREKAVVAGRIASALANADGEFSIFLGPVHLWRDDGRKQASQGGSREVVSSGTNSAIDRFRARRKERQDKVGRSIDRATECQTGTKPADSSASTEVRSAMRHAALQAFGAWASPAGEKGKHLVQERITHPGELHERPVWVTSSAAREESQDMKLSHASSENGEEGSNSASIECPGMCSSGMMRALFHCAKETASAGCEHVEAVEAMRNTLHKALGQCLANTSGAYEPEGMMASMEHLCTTDDLVQLSFDIDFALAVLRGDRKHTRSASPEKRTALEDAREAIDSRLDLVDREAAQPLRRKALISAFKGSAVLLGPLQCVPDNSASLPADVNDEQEEGDNFKDGIHDVEIPQPVSRFSLLAMPSQSSKGSYTLPLELPENQKHDCSVMKYLT